MGGAEIDGDRIGSIWEDGACVGRAWMNGTKLDSNLASRVNVSDRV